MRWEDEQESSNLEDRRGMSRGGGIAVGGGLTGIIVLVLALVFGVDPRALLQEGGGPQPNAGYETRRADPAEESLKRFTGVVLNKTEDVWNKLMPEKLNKRYVEPKLVLFSGLVESACGRASTASGPFYCPADQKVYLDLTFFRELATNYQAAGDFAQAYVIAHEIGHHIQNQLGILGQVHSKSGRVSKTEENQLSVRTELQADFLAGIWAHYEQSMKSSLDPGDLEEALRAANAVGDDRLQKQGQGYVVPDSFTHGTSAQRMKWFRLGFETGDLSRLMEPFKVSYSQL